VSGLPKVAKEIAMNLLRKSAIVAAVAALVALASEAAPGVLALVSAERIDASALSLSLYDAATRDRAASGYMPANVSWPSLFEANWR
jgi:hypothetical protein